MQAGSLQILSAKCLYGNDAHVCIYCSKTNTTLKRARILSHVPFFFFTFYQKRASLMHLYQVDHMIPPLVFQVQSAHATPNDPKASRTCATRDGASTDESGMRRRRLLLYFEFLLSTRTASCL